MHGCKVKSQLEPELLTSRGGSPESRAHFYSQGTIEGRLEDFLSKYLSKSVKAFLPNLSPGKLLKFWPTQPERPHTKVLIIREYIIGITQKNCTCATLYDMLLSVL